ncbi:MAG: tetratricopeptide repeat protein [Candidatus Eremiobacteraeota bacterium]|nr:tetratricopeptide repeat protein [Candidatus Eremiobacteraeota bacterium]
MPTNRIGRSLTGAVLAAGLLATTGCAGSIERWIVNTRVHQGDVALDRGEVRDSLLAYGLALKVDARDPRARAGFVKAAAGLAQAEYSKGNFDDALATIHDGMKIDPQSVRLQALETIINDAKIKREIVISNYPTYHDAGVQLEQAYAQLDTSNKALLKSLKRFAYTFDGDDLTDAIKRSYELQIDLSKNTNRLIVYRQLVTSGVPAVPGAQETAPSTTSLLPLP